MSKAEKPSGGKRSEAGRLLKDLKPPDRDVTIAGNMVSIETAHALLTRLGYKDIEIADLLETAAFLAGES